MSDKRFEVLEFASKNDIKFFNFCFTTPSGRFARITHHIESVNQKTFNNGISFDGSSISGWKSIENSDMLLIPDCTTAFVDPFTAQPTLCVICDIFDVQKDQFYNRDPRHIAKKAEEFLQNDHSGQKVVFGMEMEFFVFEDVRFAVDHNRGFFQLDSTEGAYNSGREYEYNNHGHRYPTKDCYFASGPNDSLNDIRSEILETLKEIKIKPMLHHHEVASSQCEVGFSCGGLVESCDNTQKCKYAVRGVASSYGKSATFMPKPFKDDNGSGMHMHQSIWQDGKNLFAPTQSNQKISEICLYYIGGILKHAKALNAFTNPTTNSYRRLVPGYEAPTAIAYSFCNRSSAIRIPYYTSSLSSSAARIEARFPDACANSYFAATAMLLAGINGIKNKIHPGQSMDKNLFESNDKNLKRICSNLQESLNCLNIDRDFLKLGNIFDDDIIDSYITQKTNEIKEINMHPTPIEFVKYYSS